MDDNSFMRRFPIVVFPVAGHPHRETTTTCFVINHNCYSLFW